MNKEFDSLCEKCPRLESLLEEQQKNKLSKKQWLAVMRLFINAGRVKLAREFSEYSDKHDYESDKTIDNLSIQVMASDVRCEELGCAENDVSQCFTKVKHIKHKNRKVVGVIGNSPYRKIRLTLEEKKTVGVYYVESGGQEKLKINANTYARFILSNYRLMYHDSEIYYIYKANCWHPLSDFKMRKIMRSLFNKLERDQWTTAFESAYMGTLCYECWDINNLKSAENYINVYNGLLDLRKNEVRLIPHDKMIFTTSQIPISYNREAKCPEFEKFLQVIFKGNKKLISLVQEIMGYCLSSSVKAHKMFMFLGAGSNGKSVLCEIMTAIAGGVENVSNVSLKGFNNKFSLSQIVNKTLNISAENETKEKLDTQYLKSIASGDNIQIEEKFKNPLSYKPHVKLVFAMNSLPKVEDLSYGFERRLIIVPFDQKFVFHEPRTANEIEADPSLMGKLEKELDGIFAFAICGLERLRQNNYVFTSSKKSKATLEDYKETINPYLDYANKHLTYDKNAKVSSATLREHFKKWCEEEGYNNLLKVAAKTFWIKMTPVLNDKGIEFDRTKSSKRFVVGIRIKGVENDS